MYLKLNKTIKEIAYITSSKESEIYKYVKKYKNKIIVIKFGGNTIENREFFDFFSQDIKLITSLEIYPIIIHGGGPQINNMLNSLGIKSNFLNGLRVTNKATIEIVEMVLSGSINKKIASKLCKEGLQAVGLSGKDCNLITANKLKINAKNLHKKNNKIEDLGYVGKPNKINTNFIKILVKNSLVPVIAPIGIGPKNQTYNINADTVAGEIASSLGAIRLLMLTDVKGVLNKNKDLISEITLKDLKSLIKTDNVSGGMIPKLETCANAIKSGVKAAVILDGKNRHALIHEIFTEKGIGTLIREK